MASLYRTGPPRANLPFAFGTHAFAFSRHRSRSKLRLSRADRDGSRWDHACVRAASPGRVGARGTSRAFRPDSREKTPDARAFSATARAFCPEGREKSPERRASLTNRATKSPAPRALNAAARAFSADRREKTPDGRAFLPTCTTKGAASSDRRPPCRSSRRWSGATQGHEAPERESILLESIMHRGIIAFVVLALSLLATVRTAGAADLDDVRSRGVLKHLGVPYANFVTGSGDGMDVEMIQAFAKSLGVRYEYVETEWGTVLPDLTGKTVKMANGHAELQGSAPIKGDLVANGFTVLPWRQEVVDFSPPTFPSQIWLVARADSKVRPIEPTGDIKKDIELTRALMKKRTVLTLGKTCLDAGLYNLGAAGAKVVAFEGKLNELAPALINGDAEMTILDVPDALIALEKWHSRIKILGPISDKQQMAVAFPKNAPKLQAAFDAFLAKTQRDGTYLKLVKKYYPAVAGYFPDFFKGM
jgi:ABC-type amino acid transport substrate-binding protein